MGSRSRAALEVQDQMIEVQPRTLGVEVVRVAERFAREPACIGKPHVKTLPNASPRLADAAGTSSP
jgi:hypothetical protein